MNDLSFTKLFSTIITSSMWSEDSETRIVWITMLALSNWRGEVMAAIPGLARAANVSLEVCERALAKFSAPDPYSRSSAHEGRRIEKVEGGWRLLNYEMYRSCISEDERREYKRNWDRENRPNRPKSCQRKGNKTPDKSRQNPTVPTHKEVEVDKEADTDKEVPLNPKGGLGEIPKCDEYGNDIPDSFRTLSFTDTLKEWHAYKRERREAYKPTGAKQCLLKLLAMGNPEIAIQAMRDAMGNNWMGFFLPKNGSNANGHFKQPINPNVPPPATPGGF